MWYCGVLLEVPVAVCTLYFCSLFRPLVLWGMYCPVAGSKHPFLCLKKTSTEPEREPALVIRNQKFSHIWAGHYCLDRILELLLGLLWEVKICEFKCYRISSLLDDILRIRLDSNSLWNQGNTIDDLLGRNGHVSCLVCKRGQIWIVWNLEWLHAITLQVEYLGTNKWQIWFF